MPLFDLNPPLRLEAPVLVAANLKACFLAISANYTAHPFPLERPTHSANTDFKQHFKYYYGISGT